jgi:hypothetical protein
MDDLITRDYSHFTTWAAGRWWTWRLEMGLDDLGCDVKKYLLPARYHGEECNALTAV